MHLVSLKQILPNKPFIETSFSLPISKLTEFTKGFIFLVIKLADFVCTRKLAKDAYGWESGIYFMAFLHRIKTPWPIIVVISVVMATIFSLSCLKKRNRFLELIAFLLIKQEGTKRQLPHVFSVLEITTAHLEDNRVPTHWSISKCWNNVILCSEFLKTQYSNSPSFIMWLDNPAVIFCWV